MKKLKTPMMPSGICKYQWECTIALPYIFGVIA